MPEIHATLVKIFLVESGARENSGYRYTTGVVISNFQKFHFFFFAEPLCCLIFVVFEAATRCLSWWLSDNLGTCCTRTGDPVTAGLVSYPLDHEVLVEVIILELPDEL
jgi:hypothetical protein